MTTPTCKARRHRALHGLLLAAAVLCTALYIALLVALRAGTPEEEQEQAPARIADRRGGASLAAQAELYAVIRGPARTASNPAAPPRSPGVSPTVEDQEQLDELARQRWSLGEEQTARRMAELDRELGRRRARQTASPDIRNLDRIASDLLDAPTEARRHSLLRRFQQAAAALDSPEREQRLAQLDRLLALDTGVAR